MSKGLSVLMVSTDRHIARAGSSVSERMKEYGKLVGELHIILFSDKKHELHELTLSENVWVYPTNSKTKYFRAFDAVKIGKKFDCDLITTQDPFECGWVGLKLKKDKNVALEVQLHTDSFSVYFGGFLNFVRRLIARRVLRQADGIRVVTKYMAERINEAFGIPRARIHILPIYIDHRRLQSGAEKLNFKERFGWDKTLIWVGRLSKEKHASMAIRALALAREKFPNLGLVIVGGGPEESKLRTLVKNLGQEDFVFFAGWQDEPGSYYQAADIFIQTSKYEGYGMALIEAGLVGLPVISTPVGIANELEPGLDLLVAPGRHSFAKAVMNLLSDREKAKALSESLKKRLEEELLTKEGYLALLKENWQRLAHKN